MKQNLNTGHDRRAFLRNAAMGGGVLAFGPLTASLAGSIEAAPAVAGGKFDFDTPFNRMGHGVQKYDEAARSAGLDHLVAGMGIADMDFPCPPAVTAALRARIALEDWGYVEGRNETNNPVLVKAIIDYTRRRYGTTTMTPNNVALVVGGALGLRVFAQGFATPASKCLIMSPTYGGFSGSATAAGATVVDSPMKLVNGRWEINWDDLESKMTPDVKFSYICNPNNPTGNFWSKDELTRYGELCLKHKVIVMSDELHCDFVQKGQKFTPFANLDKAIVANSVTLQSTHKSFSIPTFKCAWIHSTNPDLMKAIAPFNNQGMDYLSMVASTAALNGSDDWMDQCAAYIDGNHDFFRNYVRTKIPLVKLDAKPEGTYLVWMDITGIAAKLGPASPASHEPMPAPAPAAGRGRGRGQGAQGPEGRVSQWLAKNAFITPNGGSVGHIRVNIATSRKTLNAALDSMAAALNKISV